MEREVQGSQPHKRAMLRVLREEAEVGEWALREGSAFGGAASA